MNPNRNNKQRDPQELRFEDAFNTHFTSDYIIKKAVEEKVLLYYKRAERDGITFSGVFQIDPIRSIVDETFPIRAHYCITAKIPYSHVIFDNKNIIPRLSS